MTRFSTCRSLRFFDAVDETALRQAFIDVMTRHTVLRSRFVEQQGEVVQVVVPAAELSDYQWFRFSQETPAGNAAALLADAGQHRFDLAAELPLRAAARCGQRPTAAVAAVPPCGAG